MSKSEILVLVEFLKTQKADVEAKVEAIISFMGFNAVLDAFEFNINENIDDTSRKKIAQAILTGLLA